MIQTYGSDEHSHKIELHLDGWENLAKESLSKDHGEQIHVTWVNFGLYVLSILKNVDVFEHTHENIDLEKDHAQIHCFDVFEAGPYSASNANEHDHHFGDQNELLRLVFLGCSQSEHHSNHGIEQYGVHPKSDER